VPDRRPFHPVAGPAEEPSAAAVAGFTTHRMAILFADVARFSQLTDAQLPHFVKHFLGLVAVVLKVPSAR
jgi:hypothetical protein